MWLRIGSSSGLFLNTVMNHPIPLKERKFLDQLRYYQLLRLFQGISQSVTYTLHDAKYRSDEAIKLLFETFSILCITQTTYRTGKSNLCVYTV
jgi:hypothetical protein